MEENLPPGFRFHPTDEELITHYLSEKVSDLGFTSKVIADVDLNKCEPWDLPAKASMGEKEWYFFSLKDRKYPTGLRTNRATEAGYWKTTGKDKEIYRQVLLVGMKKTLVFYKGRAPKGEKTNWVMHEYRLQTNHSFRSSKDEWVVCRVFQKNVVIKRPQLTSSSLDQQSPDSQDETNTTISNEFGDIELPNPSLFSSCSTFDINHPDPLTNYTNIINSNLSLNSDLNMSNSNWLLPLSSWSSNLLSPALNSTVNSLLLKALQFRNMTDYSTYNQQVGIMPQFGANFTTSSNLTTSTSLPNYTVSSTSNNNNFDQQPPMRSEHVYDQPEQPFNWTPFIE